ncbi:MAG: hypothetical protein JST54_28895 [Deltaproteobacteria bacterium]|nr:hypothetical protein [Deltaproteobacteria bacterium]
MAAKAKRIAVHATTGTARSEYGENVYLQVHIPDDASRSLATERLLAAATYRAAAEVEEGIGDRSTCAVCVEAHEGRIHLEFASRASQAEQDTSRAVLDAVAGEINRRSNR